MQLTLKRNVDIFRMLVLIFLILPTNSLAKDSSTPSFSYNVHIAFSYISLLALPGSSSSSGFPKLVIGHSPINGNYLADPTPVLSKPTPSRTLGLKDCHIDLAWEEINNTLLEVTLRPDAELNRSQNTSNIPTDYDTRAGQTYKPAPTIYLLDSYRVSFFKGDSVVATLGVFDELSPYYIAYPTPLMFGLLTMLPQKFSALKITLKQHSVSPPLSQQEIVPTLVTALTLLSGDRDRGEIIAANDNSHDSATTTQDAYLGMAVNATFYRSLDTEYGAMYGTYDTKWNEGKQTDTFGQIFGSLLAKIGEKPVKLSIDTRYNRTSWRQTAQGFKTLEQTSGSLTSSIKLRSDRWLILGGHLGKSMTYVNGDYSKVQTFQGWEADLGLMGAITSTINMTLMSTYESRSAYQGGTKSGGFISSSDTVTSLPRYALEISYNS